MKRNRLNLALAIVAAGLGVGLYFAQEKKEPGPPVTPLASDAITRVAIAHPGAPAITLEKQDGKWFLTAPVRAEADEFEVNAPLGIATQETKDKVEGAKLAELGLEPPAWTLTLNDVAIAFGGVEPLNYRRYVKVGETVSLIDDPPSAALDKDYADLVAKNLLPPDAEIERIQLKALTLAKGADGKWALSPADPKAGADQMQKLADAWKNARSMWNEQAKQAPKGDIARVTLKDGTVREFVVAATDPQLKLHRADLNVTFVMSRALVDEMLKLPPPEPPKEEKKEEAKPAE